MFRTGLNRLRLVVRLRLMAGTVGFSPTFYPRKPQLGVPSASPYQNLVPTLLGVVPNGNCGRDASIPIG